MQTQLNMNMTNDKVMTIVLDIDLQSGMKKKKEDNC
jgi:hypothetical protein